MSIHALDHRLVRVLIAFGLALLASGAGADIAKVNGLLRRAEANISSVTASIGNRTSPPRGSAAKLAASRLEQAIGDLNPAGELLSTIPAGTAGRDEAVAKYTELANEYNRLRAILTGSDAPSEPVKKGTTLNYQQKELLSNARFHLSEVEGNAALLTERTGQMRTVEDQLTIDHRDVVSLRGVVENARRKTGFAKDALDQLPADGDGVPEVRQALVNADAKVSVASDYLNPLHAELQKVIDPANYPAFESDFKRLRELSIMYARPEILTTNRPMAAEAFGQADAAKDECIRIARQYVRLIQQQTDQGKRLEGVGNGFLSNHASFLAEAETTKAALPAEIRKDLAKAQEDAAMAVAEQKPMWFTGGIPQTMAFAEDRVTLLEALDPESGKAMRTEFEKTERSLEKQAEALRDLIIRENRMPEDRFEGDDREKAIETAISGWKVQQKEFKLLKVRIPSEAWARETKWTYSNGTWYFSDRSRLQVRLLVADHENEELAIDRPINVWKDHQKGDTMIGVPLWGFKDTLQPSSYMLRSKIK